jgi:hypothetical protein
MKIILFPFFLLITIGSAYAQKMPEINYNVRISEADKTIRAEINPIGSKPVAKPGLYYYWYGANIIHSTQGGYGGNLLNGQYNEYYLNKNLREQGIFKKGLKDGTWKAWNEDGTLSSTATWKNGIIVSDSSPSFWKRLNVFRKREKHSSADSSAKSQQ